MPRKSELLDDLTTQIGYSETIQLVRAWGGRRLRVPKEPDANHPIALTIGLVAARQLALYHGGAELELPAERNAIMEVRNNAILRDLDNGHSTRACALRYGLTPRHVRYINNRHRARLQQGGDVTPSE